MTQYKISNRLVSKRHLEKVLTLIEFDSENTYRLKGSVTRKNILEGGKLEVAEGPKNTTLYNFIIAGKKFILRVNHGRDRSTIIRSGWYNSDADLTLENVDRFLVLELTQAFYNHSDKV